MIYGMGLGLGFKVEGFAFTVQGCFFGLGSPGYKPEALNSTHRLLSSSFLWFICRIL